MAGYSGSNYVLGRSDQETTRLQNQAQFYNSFTRWIFQQAGIRDGMKVLDIGSGAGDVSLLAAELVGPEGCVVGVDINSDVLEIARRRAKATGLNNVRFQAGDIRDIDLADDFDAVVGRLVLMYQDDPVAGVRKAINHLKSGGIVVFEELDARIPVLADPPSPILDAAIRWVWAVFEKSGARTRMGLNLYKTFQAAGLPAPTMQLFTPVGGGSDWAGYDLLADTLRSLLPKIMEYGIASADEVDIDSFAERFRNEFVRTGSVSNLPAHVGAWAIKP